MKTANVENVVVDEAHGRTYVVMASRTLTDGELYQAIRQELLMRGGVYPKQGESLVITVEDDGAELRPHRRLRSPKPKSTDPLTNGQLDTVVK